MRNVSQWTLSRPVVHCGKDSGGGGGETTFFAASHTFYTSGALVALPDVVGGRVALEELDEALDDELRPVGLEAG